MVDLTVLAEDPYPALALITGGILSLFIAIYGRRDDSHLDEIGTLFAFILGIVMIVMAYFVGSEGSENWFTLVMIVVLAATLFLKPLKELPWSGLFGVIAGAVAAFVASLFLPSTMFGIDEWIVLIAIFFIVAGIVHGLFHNLEDALTIATMVVGWKPVMILVGLVTIVEGALVLMDKSLLSLL
ncbi:MAG: hypothetical protein ACUVT7_07785 [Thermoplasmata archaeon]